MSPETALLPLCIAVGVLGLILAVLLWLRDRRGRAVQALGLSAAIVGLYLTGLLRMLWDAVVAVARWASSIVFDTTIWAGFGLIALAVLLWVVGGAIASRNRTRRAVAKARGEAVEPASGRRGEGTRGTPAGRKAAGAKSASSKSAGGKAQPADPELDEIEALLRSRGIE